jgi:glycosyltransferase involved in cell wall biosynthesis
VYAVDHGGPMDEMLAAEGVSSRVFSRGDKLDFRLIGRMASQFRADKVRLVHTHHLCQLIYAGLAGRLAGARIVHTEHEVYSLSRSRTRKLLRVVSAVADTVTAVAEPVAVFLREQVGIPSRKLKTITTGVDVSRFSSAVPLTRSALDWRDDDVVIGCVARLEPEKGHAILLDAFRFVSARNRRARLLLIGDGGERERLVAMAQAFGLNGSVRFLGIRSDIPELLKTCDMTVLASSQEGLPIALLEAMAAGKPVVATRVGSVPQVVQDGLTGLLVPPGDAAALAEALETLVADHLTRRRLAERAFKLVGSHYRFDRTLKQYEEVFDAVLSRGRS